MIPNVPGALVNLNYFRDQGTALSPWNKYSLRADHHFSAANHISFLYMDGTKDDTFGADGPPGLPMPFNGNSVWYRGTRSGRFSWDSTISPRVLNSFRFNMQGERGGLTTMNSIDPEAGWAEKIGLSNAPGPDRGLTPIAFAEYTQWSGSAWGFDRGRNTIITNDVTMIRGSHTIKPASF